MLRNQPGAYPFFSAGAACAAPKKRPWLDSAAIDGIKARTEIALPSLHAKALNNIDGETVNSRVVGLGSDFRIHAMHAT
jgi:hypothetical protein